MQHLVNKEQEALRYSNEGYPAEAALLLEEIVTERPDWEHGSAWYMLGTCYEELERLEDAKKCFALAIKYDPHNSIFLVGYADFLYTHNFVEAAFNAYLTFLKSENCKGKFLDECISRLKELAPRLGISNERVYDFL